ncbi:rhodanese-like domain-containing protein [Phocoenobacter skyensis]|uniref:Rhodanese-like domain-containing protein n=1 Tax=Phocoenobacter skyensis TaxID=97481 RepID=A0A1H7VFS6_9PAST|nr:rhodanese-like domain-containing protein [Pasteurella skyensis]MDP8079346.1 rhodanese-like domain-containing protein [Pasteurella skyensis]MDP8085218.1 rhodanese-like domain-containing protein [Pasteurella skyensis]MDP8162673.1 rhodanese-like domain-containing protein [Pasteurella skyensis]MDP8171409.1 rhodanese-like domain-containing protein [Pasteurella skyensis]MDP8173441.1 rhodanese-like domain-containing protein [Pasteurella skyensis]
MSNIKTIEAIQLQEWLTSGEAVLVDVREPSEFTEWRIPYAISMPLTNIDQHIPHLATEKRKIVFQCLKGKRGEMAAGEAIKLFPEADIYNLTGGIEAWDKAELTIIRDVKKGKMPMMRQVLIAAGGLNILFSLIGFSSGFGTLMTLLLGGGLLFAGLTGKCGMALALQKMPWNK